MTKQLYYEDVAVDNEIPPLTKLPTTRQNVMWAGASTDFYPIHYDKAFAQSQGLPDVILPGHMVLSFLGQLMTDWIGDEGSIKKLNGTYRIMGLTDETLICKGVVSKKYVENGEHYVECNIWAENPKEEKIVTGEATVIIPARG